MSTGMNFWDSDVWAFLMMLGLLLTSMLVAHILIRTVKPLQKLLLPSSVLGGLLLLAVSTIVYLCTGKYLFEMELFSGSPAGVGGIIDGGTLLETITYHCLGLGFVAMALRTSSGNKGGKKRSREIFDSGCCTVATYLMQAVLGIAVTMIAATVLKDLFSGSGILLAFGFGQGTGQALNYGNIYETDAVSHFVGGKSFGLTVAALGFLCANIFGVIYMNILQKKGKIGRMDSQVTEQLELSQIQAKDEIPMISSMDKMTIQLGLVVSIYALSFIIMRFLGNLVGEGLRATIFGFNFLIGTALAILLRFIMNLLRRKGIIHRQYVNNFMMNRISGFLFDVMIVAGIGAIKIHLIRDYWLVLLILAVVGGFSTFFYVRFVSNTLFPEYPHEQFFAMFGMLTGTASTGMILLREVDAEFRTPAADNLVFQTLPAILFGFPMMLLATYIKSGGPAVLITLGACVAFFVVMNLILFRTKIFKKKSK